jgi:hypothetical protein
VNPILPRRYTLTHSDRTGHFYLTVAPEYEVQQFNGLYTRLMRDEVLAEWVKTDEEYELHVYVHVSGGFVVGSPKRRNKALKRELPLALESIRYGDQYLVREHPKLGASPVFVHFQSKKETYHRVEPYGTLDDYKVIVTTSAQKTNKFK